MLCRKIPFFNSLAVQIEIIRDETEYAVLKDIRAASVDLESGFSVVQITVLGVSSDVMKAVVVQLQFEVAQV